MSLFRSINFHLIYFELKLGTILRLKLFFMPFNYYCNNPTFSSLGFLSLDDKKLVSFMVKEGFNVNKKWAHDNPVLHLLLANERFNDFERFLDLIPQYINPNLCDGPFYGKKSLLILLTMMVSNGMLPLKFIKQYKEKIDFNYQDSSGRTALHYAVILGRYDIADALIQAGASSSIDDKYKKRAFDYLFCAESCINSVLKQIDIEPTRDIEAKNNVIKDHRGRPLTLQGVQLVQKKSIVGHVLQGVKDGNCRLVKYIKGHLKWSTFIGDDTQPTYIIMADLAQQIATTYHKNLDKILVCEMLSPEEQDQFFDYLLDLDQKLSGNSILSGCLAGHKMMSKYYEHEAPRSISSFVS